MRLTNMNRQTKKTKFNAAGLSHASGWVETADLPAFADMVKRAEGKVADVLSKEPNDGKP